MGFGAAWAAPDLKRPQIEHLRRMVDDLAPIIEVNRDAVANFARIAARPGA